MSSQLDNTFGSFVAKADITAWRAVKQSGANGIDIAGAGDAVIGIAQSNAKYDSSVVTTANVKMLPGVGTFRVTVNGAVSVGDRLYVAANGKFTKTSNGGRALLIANQASSADGDIIEALHAPAASSLAFMPKYTLVSGDGSNGYVDVDTGLAAAPNWFNFTCQASGGTNRVIASVVWTLGVARVTITSAATNDVLRGAWSA